MSSDTKPDDATGDSVTNAELITRVHAFLCALLTFLGFNTLPNETTFGMLNTLTQWLADAKAVRDDRQGVTSSLWWEAFKAAWLAPKSSSMLAHSTKEAGKAADAAIAEFGQRFVPVVTEGERDTLNTADFDAMRAELDAADRYRGEIVDAIDGRPGERAFMHPRIIDELRAERDALLKANAHHASEIELERSSNKALWAQCDAFRDALFAAMGKCGDDGVDVIATVAVLRKERDELKAKLAGAIVPLPKPERVEPGQRWLVDYVVDSIETDGGKGSAVFEGSRVQHLCGIMLFPNSRYVYLGTDKV